MIVCLSAWKRSGKDGAADILVNEFKFNKVSFANVLKDMVAEQYGIPRESLDNQDLKEQPLFQYPAVPSDDFSRKMIEFMGKELKLDGNGNLYWTPRSLAILEGSVKRSVTSKYWTGRALSLIKPGDLAVIADLRYKSEVEQVQKYAQSIGEKSLIIRINRFDESPSTDASERDMDDFEGFDYVVENRGSLEEFQDKIREIVFSNL